jgi:hypothetical protein
MSGPKVVRVVSRDELVAEGEALLRRLNAALSQWEEDCTAIGTNVTEYEATKSRRDALEQMLRADQFALFGQAVQSEIEYLQLDATKRRERAVQARAQERLRQERGREVARALLNRASEAPSELRQELQIAAEGGFDLAGTDAVLSRARQHLFKVDDTALTPTQKELAARLAQSAEGGLGNAAMAPAVAPDARLQAMFAHLAELDLLGGAEQAKALNAQLVEARDIAEEARRQMRLDTLVVGIKQAKEAAVALASLLRSAQMLGAEIPADADGDILRQRLVAAASLGNSLELQSVIAQTEKDFSALKATRAAAHRRQVILAGLADLGYEVHEELSTATPSNGRIVMRNSADADYGVELASTPGMERIQVRTVAFESDRNTTGDIPAEQRWCTDFGRLQATMRAAGTDLVIEKSLGVGAVPLKVLHSTLSEERRRQASTQKGRVRKL